MITRAFFNLIPQSKVHTGEIKSALHWSRTVHHPDLLPHPFCKAKISQTVVLQATVSTTKDIAEFSVCGT
jgi:hypothetical protein